MNYVTMGRSGLKVSRACLGAMNFGTASDAPADEAEGRRVIDAFLEAGNNFIDTANVYTAGQSEEIVGRAVRGRRDSVVIATKARVQVGPGPNDVGLSRVHMTRALEDSLRRLGTDYVDIYQCHSWDTDTPIEETMAALDSFVRAGKVRYIGCSNFSAAQIVESQWAAARNGLTPFISLQPPYSLLTREIEKDILPTCARHGLGTLVYSPLASGVLTGKYRRGADPAEGTRLGRILAMPGMRERMGVFFNDRTFDIVDEVAKVAAEVGTTPTAVAIAWTLRRPEVTSVIIGPRTLSQHEENMVGFDIELPEALGSRLDEVSASPETLFG